MNRGSKSNDDEVEKYDGRSMKKYLIEENERIKGEIARMAPVFPFDDDDDDNNSFNRNKDGRDASYLERDGKRRVVINSKRIKYRDDDCSGIVYDDERHPVALSSFRSIVD